MPTSLNSARPQIYDGEGEALMASFDADHVTLLPSSPELARSPDRIRILWGQPMLGDILSGRYRTVVCGVNASDNSHGIVAQLAELLPASQWTHKTITSHARAFSEQVAQHGGEEHEPYVVKFDLEQVELFALLRPHGRDHFTLADLRRGFMQVAKMLDGRRARQPAATVSFLGARSNRLIDPKTGAEPSFESVLRAMFEAGYRGDVYPSPQMWQAGDVGVFPTYPFPKALDTMREGGH